MTGARLRSTAAPHGLAPVGPCHTVRMGSARVTDGAAPLLIPSQEHRQQAERAGSEGDRRQQGLLPVRAATLGAGSEASKARPEGVALSLSYEDADRLKVVLSRHLKAIRKSVAFWEHEHKTTLTELQFDLEERKREAELIQRVYLELFDVSKEVQTKLKEKADSKANYNQE